ncbi:hypothetical protein Z042_23770 [Chania multitudinisentens RB-25]|uniref:Lipoprotein n=1 Tax=Chania multitudinisentens RB-25 TaxID=1441930 RepID=W0LEV8_9GAMM|nr:hypothetical protein [Chania multitudinisentens]AHG22281.1 hypothetical protein Z042_23770 [Chania multitudinisentens RB-25]
MKNKVFIITLTIILSGCSTPWEPIGNPAMTLQNTQDVCKSSSLSLFPIKNEVATRSVEKQISIKCNNKENCDKSGYRYEKKLGVESYSLDVNKHSRQAAFSSCMEKNGWKKPGVYNLLDDIFP